MGSNETATATTGAPRVIDVFDSTRRHRGQITYFFRMQISSWRPLGAGLVVGGRPYRIRRRCGGLVLSESPGSHCQVIHAVSRGLLREIGQKCLKRRRMRCRRLRVSSTDPRRPQGHLRATNQQDSAGAAVMVGPSISRIEKIIFFDPQ